MGLINSVDTMILGANTHAEAKGHWPYADEQGEISARLPNAMLARMLECHSRWPHFVSPNALDD